MIDREILIGVTGGIAAYKSAYLVSQLVQEGAKVSVIMTDTAHQFIGPATFTALTGRPVAEHSFEPKTNPLGAHITLSQQAELMCVVPCTANFLGKAAHGIADDLLSTTYLAFDGKVMLAPAMNAEMWAKPAVQRNVTQLKEDGVLFVDPEPGWLSCRQSGVGRMADPETIFQAIQTALGEPA